MDSQTAQSPSPIELFFCYAHEDKALCDEFERHLAPLRMRGLIHYDYSGAASAGARWEELVNAHTRKPYMILIMLSPSLLSGGAHEIKTALAYQGNGAYIIPILLRPCDYQDLPISRLQMLPEGNQPVAGQDHDSAFTHIVHGIRRAIEKLAPRTSPVPEPSHEQEDVINYLQRLYEEGSTLPGYYPRDFRFEDMRQNVKLNHKRFRVDDEKAAEQREAKRRSGESDEEEPPGSPRIADWEEIRAQIKRGIILSDPGFGKSWLLQHESRRLAGELLARSQHGRVDGLDLLLPIHLHLSTVAALLASHQQKLDEALLAALVQKYQLSPHFSDYLRRKLDRGRCILLLDALDEVEPERRGPLREALIAFSKENTSHILLTSRFVGYQPLPLKITNQRIEPELELVAFGDEQITSFIHAWFAQDATKAQELIHVLQQQTSLAALAQIPLLLSFLCLIHMDKATLPTNRSALYDEVLHKLLWKKWRVSREHVVQEHLIYQKITLLEHLAFYFATKNGLWHDYFTAQDVWRFAPGEQQQHLLRELIEQDGILVKSGESYAGIESSQVPYLFLHRTLYEYLVARYLSHLPETEWKQFIHTHLWFDSDWRNVIILLASQLQSPEPLLTLILKEPDDAYHEMLFLAGHCLLEAGQQAVLSRWKTHLCPRLRSLLFSPSPHDCLQSYSLLYKLADPELTRELLTAFYSKQENIQTTAAQALSDLGTQDVIEGLLKTRKQIDRSYEELIVRILINMHDHQLVIEQMTAFLKQGTLAQRRVAISVLKNLRHLGTDIFPALLVACQDKDPDICSNALDTLGTLSDYVIQHGESTELAWMMSAYHMSRKKYRAVYKKLASEREQSQLLNVAVLHYVRSEQVYQTLISLRHTQDKNVRRVLLWTLGTSGDQRAIPTIMELATQNPSTIESIEHALRSLWWMGGIQAYQYIIAMLFSENDEIKAKVDNMLYIDLGLQKRMRMLRGTFPERDDIDDPVNKAAIQRVYTNLQTIKQQDSRLYQGVLELLIVSGDRCSAEVIMQELTTTTDDERQRTLLWALDQFDLSPKAKAFFKLLNFFNGHMYQYTSLESFHAEKLHKIQMRIHTLLGTMRSLKDLEDIVEGTELIRWSLEPVAPDHSYSDIRPILSELKGPLLWQNLLEWLSNAHNKYKTLFYTQELFYHASEGRPASWLLDTTQHQNPKMREAAIFLLGHLCDKGTIHNLINDFFEHESKVHHRVGNLVDVEEKEIRQLLAPVLKSDDESRRNYAATILWSLGNTRLHDRLISSLSDQDSNVRRAAIVALGQLRVRLAYRALMPFINTPENSGEEVELALGRLGDLHILQKYRDRLRSADEEQREHAATMLGDIASQGAADALRARLRTNPPDQGSVVHALNRIAYQYYIEVPLYQLQKEIQSKKSLYHTDDFPIDGDIIEALSRITDPEATEALAALYARVISHDIMLRAPVTILQALSYSQHSTPTILSVLQSALGHENGYIRQLAAEAIGALREAKFLDRLLKIARNDKDERVRLAAVDALGRIGDSRAAETLYAVYRHDRYNNVTRAALEALEKIDILPIMPGLLNDLKESGKDYSALLIIYNARKVTAQVVEVLLTELQQGRYLTSGPEIPNIFDVLARHMQEAEPQYLFSRLLTIARDRRNPQAKLIAYELLRIAAPRLRLAIGKNWPRLQAQLAQLTRKLTGKQRI